MGKDSRCLGFEVAEQHGASIGCKLRIKICFDYTLRNCDLGSSATNEKLELSATLFNEKFQRLDDYPASVGGFICLLQ